MKTKILSILSTLALAILFQGCHDPKELISNGDPKGILALTAKIVGDDSSDNNFQGVIDYDAHTITVRFPIYYPVTTENDFDAELIKNVRVTAAMATNATIEPALTTMDLSRTNYITVTNAQKERVQYSVKGEIVPYWENEAVDMEMENGIACVIDNEKNVITILSSPDADLEPMTASITLSPHATVEPDITTQPFDFDAEGAKITVIAQNGTDKREYTFTKGEPRKVPFGLREESFSLRWVKRWDEVGYTLKSQQTGFGVTEQYLILNEKGNMKAKVIDAKKGTDTGKVLDMGIIPLNMNHNMTSDCAGHIIVNSKYGDQEPMFKLWVFDGVDDKGRLLINASVYGAGDRVSVYGDITKDAVIVTPLSGTSLQACRWFIKDGVLGESEVFMLGGVDATPWGNVDIAPTSATTTQADQLAVFYATVGGKRGPVLFSGTSPKGTHPVKSIGKPNTKKRSEADGGLADAGNWVMNACDYVEFNKNKYFIHNSVNTFNWGANDFVYLIDVTGGTLDKELFKTSDTHGAIAALNNSTDGMYGAMAAGNTGLAGNCDDVRLWVDNTGLFMYAYFLFTDGYMGCMRMDCIDK